MIVGKGKYHLSKHILESMQISLKKKVN